MSLRKKQSEFALALAKLIIWAYRQGYEVTIGDVWSRPWDVVNLINKILRHVKNSFHHKKLAADLNLFKDGKYLRKLEDHLPLGLKWEALGGSWGGRFGNKDANHYSWGEGRS